MHAANLVKEIYKICPAARISGLGGPKMAAAGCEIHYDMMNKSFMWFRKVFANLHWVYRIQKQLLAEFDANPPDALILIDYPGFNLTLARWMKNRPTPVLYYIAPQIWAWFTHRVYKIKARIQKLFVVLPFEKAIYEAKGIPADYVGHPLFDHLRDIEPNLDKDFMRRLQDSPRYTIGLLPGSRDAEVRRLLPVMVHGAREIKKRIPDVQFIVPIDSDVHLNVVEGILARLQFDARVAPGRAHEVMKSADLCIVTSGTATLELLHFNTPMIILYRLNLLSYLIAMSFIRTEVRCLIDSPGASRKAAEEILRFIDDYREGRVPKKKRFSRNKK